MAAENPMGLGLREQHIAALLLQGCSNTEIAKQLKMKPRTVKAHFNRLFKRFGIKDGIKRVKLATLLYRRGLMAGRAASECATEKDAAPTVKRNESLDASLRNLADREIARAAISEAVKSPLKSLNVS
jgi:DNA-binding CsgD family transcriptional regulator